MPTSPNPPSDPQRPLRLWPGVALLALLWLGAPVEARAGEFEAPAGSIRVLLAEVPASIEIDGRSRTRPGRFGGPGPHEVEGRRFRGSLELLRSEAGLRIVNEVPLAGMQPRSISAGLASTMVS